MLRDFILFIKYPYTAGIIATIWLGSAILVGIDESLPFFGIIIINVATSCLLAFFGFGQNKEI